MGTDSNRITEKRIKELLVSQTIDTISLDALLEYSRKEQQQNQFSSDIGFSIDPRSGGPIIYNPSRAKRPHDYPEQNTKREVERNTCPICAGETTGIIDFSCLSKGVTFINGNLFPALYLPSLETRERVEGHGIPWGIHLVQWSSSIHDQDWHTMAEGDRVIVMSRLAAAEKKLFQIGKEIIKKQKSISLQARDEFCVSIIKNSGAAVGGSLEHGHQQILLSNMVPKRLLDNQRFKIENGMTFSEHLQESNPQKLLLRDYGSAVLLVSKYMRRPLEMVLALKNTGKSYLHQLNHNEILAISRGWMDGIRVFHELMPAYDREIAYNVVMHNGPGAGLYFEFLPYTQEQGGFEQLGLSVCQAEPFQVADQIRVILEG